MKEREAGPSYRPFHFLIVIFLCGTGLTATERHSDSLSANPANEQNRIDRGVEESAPNVFQRLFDLIEANKDEKAPVTQEMVDLMHQARRIAYTVFEHGRKASGPQSTNLFKEIGAVKGDSEKAGEIVKKIGHSLFTGKGPELLGNKDQAFSGVPGREAPRPITAKPCISDDRFPLQEWRAQTQGTSSSLTGSYFFRNSVTVDSLSGKEGSCLFVAGNLGSKENPITCREGFIVATGDVYVKSSHFCIIIAGGKIEASDQFQKTRAIAGGEITGGVGGHDGWHNNEVELAAPHVKVRPYIDPQEKAPTWDVNTMVKKIEKPAVYKFFAETAKKENLITTHSDGKRKNVFEEGNPAFAHLIALEMQHLKAHALEKYIILPDGRLLWADNHRNIYVEDFVTNTTQKFEKAGDDYLYGIRAIDVHPNGKLVAIKKQHLTVLNLETGKVIDFPKEVKFGTKHNEFTNSVLDTALTKEGNVLAFIKKEAGNYNFPEIPEFWISLYDLQGNKIKDVTEINGKKIEGKEDENQSATQKFIDQRYAFELLTARDQGKSLQIPMPLDFDLRAGKDLSITHLEDGKKIKIDVDDAKYKNVSILSPDAKTLTFTKWGSTRLDLFNTGSGEKRQVKFEKIKSTHGGGFIPFHSYKFDAEVTPKEFSPDSKTLALAELDRDGIWFLDLETGSYKLAAMRGKPTGFRYSPDGRWSVVNNDIGFTVYQNKNQPKGQVLREVLKEYGELKESEQTRAKALDGTIAILFRNALAKSELTQQEAISFIDKADLSVEANKHLKSVIRNLSR